MISRHFPRLPFSHFLPRDWLAQPHNPIQTPITPTTPLPMPSISHPHLPPRPLLPHHRAERVEELERADDRRGARRVDGREVREVGHPDAEEGEEKGRSFPLPAWPFCMAFWFLKYATIAQGVAARAKRGMASSAQAAAVGAMAPLLMGP